MATDIGSMAPGLEGLHKTWEILAFFSGALLVAFTTAYRIKVLVSGYQSIDMHCIVLLVKFVDGLSILFLRNKQLFKKNDGHIFETKKFTFFNFHSPPLKK
jgi:hypothetical protein